MLKAKKFFASRMSDTRAGRTAILKYVGEDGDRLVRLLKAVMMQYASRETAKTLKKDLLKLASKCALLYQENQITEKDGEPFAQIAMEVAKSLIALSQRPPATITGPDISALSASIQELHDKVIALLRKHMKAANAERLTHLKDAYADKIFLATVLKSEAYAPIRASFGGVVSSLANAEQGAGGAPSQMCTLSGCMLPRSGFPGSPYCSPHHYQHYRIRVAYPRLENFLRGQHPYELFRSFAAERGITNLLLLLLGIEEYRGISNRTLRPRRADVLFRKYLSASAEYPVAGVREGTVAALDKALLDGAKSSTFNQLETELMQIVEHEFATGFCKSPQFAEFVRQSGLEAFARSHPPTPVLVHLPHPSSAPAVEPMRPWVDGCLTAAEAARLPMGTEQLTLSDVPPEFHPPAGLQFTAPEDSDDEDDTPASSAAGAAGESS